MPPFFSGYIFNARAKISDSGEWVSFIAPEDREKFEKELQKAVTNRVVMGFGSPTCHFFIVYAPTEKGATSVN